MLEAPRGQKHEGVCMQLYNLKDDTSEKTNLISSYPEKGEAMLALLERYVADDWSTLGAIQENDAEIDLCKLNGVEITRN